MSPRARRMLLSQVGPHLARAITVPPCPAYTHKPVSLPNAQFRSLLPLWRLHLPLPLAPRNVRVAETSTCPSRTTGALSRGSQLAVTPDQIGHDEVSGSGWTNVCVSLFCTNRSGSGPFFCPQICSHPAEGNVASLQDRLGELV